MCLSLWGIDSNVWMLGGMILFFSNILCAEHEVRTCSIVGGRLHWSDFGGCSLLSV